MADTDPRDESEEGRERYLLGWNEKRDDCWDAVIETLNNKGKVLWVCNTVSDAVGVYQQAKEKSLILLQSFTIAVFATKTVWTFKKKSFLPSRRRALRV